jgi:hypothetical protein
LLADTQTISSMLGVEVEQFENTEDLDNTKDILENAIAQSTYLEGTNNQRPLQIRWNLASQIDLDIIKTCCPDGYADFTRNLTGIAKNVANLLDE